MLHLYGLCLDLWKIQDFSRLSVDSCEGHSETILKIAFADSIEFTRMIKKQSRCPLYQGAPLDTLTDCLFATKIPHGALVWLETKGIMEVSMLVAIET